MNRSLSSRNGRWATISPTRTKPLAALVRGAMSLRWKLMLTFLVVIGASFAIMASILTGMVSQHLISAAHPSGHPLSGAAGFVGCAFLASAQMDGLSELLNAQAGELGGRLLAVDMDGKVQADTFGARSGQRLSIPETVAVLLHGEKSASAFTASIRNRVRRMWRSRRRDGGQRQDAGRTRAVPAGG